MKGVYGKILNIDLGRKSSCAEEIPDAVYRNLLGGKGLATYLLYGRNRARVDPLAPSNHVVLALGPAVNTKVWGSSRYGLYTRSPQTGIYAESYSGGRVAESMGQAGYDAFVLQGAAESPTVLEINDAGVVFHDARELWGLDTYESQDRIKALIGRSAGIVTIGPAGENRVRFALVANDYWRCAGRAGVGAVLGAKNLKGIAFYGSAQKQIAEPAVLEDLWSRVSSQRKTHPAIQGFKKAGTAAMVAVLNKANSFPTRYWSRGTMENWRQIDAEALHAKCRVKPRACTRCLMACGRMTTVLEGRHEGLSVEGPEYETIYAFGGLCDIDAIDEILYLNDLCDRLGLDTISAGNLAAFAIEASRLGKIESRYDYGDASAVAGLIQDMAHRRGEGAVLARGIRHAAQKWDMQDIAVHVKGLEPSGYDPRVLKGMGLAYATSDRGACHLRATVFKAELTGQIAPDRIEGKAEALIDFEDRLNIHDALITCRFYRDVYMWEGLCAIVRGTMGLKADQAALEKIAANIRDATRIFNRREGLTARDDTLPPRFFKEPLSNGEVLQPVELDRMLQDYYRLRGWDTQGAPPPLDYLAGD